MTKHTFWTASFQCLAKSLVVLPSNKLMGMCGWMGSHFHCWIDHNGVAFLLELLEWGRTFLGFGGSENSGRYRFKNGKILN